MLRLVTLNPGHFHAALVQKEKIAGIDRTVHIYAPPGPDLDAHLERLKGFNSRAENPTDWDVVVHASDNPLSQMLADKPGDILVLAGRNRVKIDAIEAGVAAGMHVLADKPWILVPEHLPRLERALDQARQTGVIAYDIMTERYEITSVVQRALARTPEVVGEILPGTPEEPAIYMESVHYLKKTVAGKPLRRPAWFFDVHEQGEGLSDVGTHLVDLAAWMLLTPEENSDCQIHIGPHRRWPTTLTREQFEAITGGTAGFVGEYFCNTQSHFQLDGRWVKLDVLWDVEAAAGTGDTHLCVVRGTQANVEVRQGAEQKFRPEVYVVPQLADRAALKAAVIERIAPLDVIDLGDRLRIAIPDRLRTGHEAHFGEVMEQFLKYVRGDEVMPEWEDGQMLVKYLITTQGVAMARQGGGQRK